jgi:hypothetical protein
MKAMFFNLSKYDIHFFMFEGHRFLNGRYERGRLRRQLFLRNIIIGTSQRFSFWKETT